MKLGHVFGLACVILIVATTLLLKSNRADPAVQRVHAGRTTRTTSFKQYDNYAERLAVEGPRPSKASKMTPREQDVFIDEAAKVLINDARRAVRRGDMTRSEYRAFTGEAY